MAQESTISKKQEPVAGVGAPPAAQVNLPAQPTPFVGREKELSEVRQLLINDPTYRLLTVVGPGGIGKTRLALEAAAGARDAFQHGIYFVPLAPLRSTNQIISALAASLPFQLEGPDEPKEELLRYLHNKEMLLLLDNFEHLLEGVGLVAEVLQGAPRVKVLVTSRERLNLSGEVVYALSGMTFPTGDGGEDLPSYEAVRFFIERAGLVRPGIHLEEEELRQAARIGRLVQGMPLALVLAAGWLEVLSLREVADEIEQSLDFLETEMHDVPERQRSMRATFEYSWKRLSAREQYAFMKLSVFRAGFTREAARAVTGADAALLRKLARKSLLSLASEGRYEIHELLRQYGKDYLEQSGEAEHTKNVHSTYYLQLLANHVETLKGYQQAEALAAIEADIENVRAAWYWAADCQQPERLEGGMDGLGYFYEWRAHYQDGANAFGYAVTRLQSGVGGEAMLLALSKLLAWESVFRRYQRDIALARQLLEGSQALLVKLEGNSRVLAVQAFVHLQRAHLELYKEREEAKRHYQHSLELYGSLGDQWNQANALAGLGEVAFRSGEVDRAVRLRRESLDIVRSLGDKRGTARILAALSWASLYRGMLEEAEQLMRESNALYMEMGDRASHADGLGKLGVVLYWRGEFSESARLLEESLAMYLEMGNRRALPRIYANLGVAIGNLRRYEEARQLGYAALEVAEETGHRSLIAWILWLLSWTALTLNQFEEAEAKAEESVSIYRRLGQTHELGWSLAMLAGAAYRQGKRDKAIQQLLELLRLVEAHHELFSMLSGFGMAAMILARESEHADPETATRLATRAVQLMAFVTRVPTMRKSPTWYDMSWGHVEVARSRLQPEVADVAQEGGLQLDPWSTARELQEELEALV